MIKHIPRKPLLVASVVLFFTLIGVPIFSKLGGYVSGLHHSFCAATEPGIGVTLRISGRTQTFAFDDPKGMSVTRYVESLFTSKTGGGYLTNFLQEDYCLIRKRDRVEIVYASHRFVPNDYVKQLYGQEGYTITYFLIPLTKTVLQVHDALVIASGGAGIQSTHDIELEDVRNSLKKLIQ